MLDNVEPIKCMKFDIFLMTDAEIWAIKHKKWPHFCTLKCPNLKQKFGKSNGRSLRYLKRTKGLATVNSDY